MKRKLLIMLALAALLALLCCSVALADESGSCGDDLTWAYDSSTGKLTISGTGAMADYLSSTAPWNAYKPLITSVVMENGVTSVGNYAFYGCAGLTDVIFPDSLTVIGNYAFHGCAGLTEVTLPISVAGIGYLSFASCSGLTSVTVINPDAVIGDPDCDVFENCPSGLVICGWNPSTAKTYAADAGITYAPLGDLSGQCGSNVNWSFDPFTGILAISGTGKMSNDSAPWSSFKTLITAVVMEDGVTSVGNSAFRGCTGLTDVTLSNDVTKIGEYAFAGCSALTDMTLPDSLTAIAGYAFNGCITLTSATFPDGLTYIGAKTFYGCAALISVTLPDSLTTIGDMAFRDCTGLISVTLSNSLTIVNDRAFWNCAALTSVTIPGSVAKIGSAAFKDCTNLDSAIIVNPNAVINEGAFNNCSSDLVIRGWPDSTAQTFATRARIAFMPLDEISGQCGANVSFTYGSVIGKLVISGTGAMADYSVGNAPWNAYKLLFTSVVIENGVTAVGQSAFEGCANLTGVTLPDSLTSVGSYAFQGCTALRGVTLPDGLTAIGDCAFEGCTALTGVTCPDNLTFIGDRAFSDCTGLTSVTLPDGLTVISDGAFMNCAALTSVTIPVSVARIGGAAFKDCTSLTGVDIGNPNAVIGDGSRDVFENCPALVIHGWPGSTAQTYAASAGIIFDAWRTNDQCGTDVNYAIDPATGKLTVSGTGAMAEYTKDTSPWNAYKPFITSVVVNNGVTSVGKYAFWGCANLTGVTLPGSLTDIRMSAFNGCTGLTEVTIPGSVAAIGSLSFANCTGLISVSIKNPNAVIGDSSYDVFKKSPSSLVIHGWLDSTAQTYAARAGIAFEPLAREADLFLPISLTAIESEAFSGISAESVVIPSGVTSIAADAFSGSHVTTIYGYAGSAAEAFCAVHTEMTFVEIDDAWMATH